MTLLIIKYVVLITFLLRPLKVHVEGVFPHILKNLVKQQQYYLQIG